MAFELKNRKITQFRCHIDPMIPPKPRNAFNRVDFPNSEFELTPAGVYVHLIYQTPGSNVTEQEHLIPFANIQSILLEPLPKDEKTK
jgi:hypothetical protein